MFYRQHDKKITDTTSNTGLNIRILRNYKNSGAGFSRRYAAEMACGEYLCFCDSDDWYEPYILNDLEAEIDQSQSDLVFFDMSYILAGDVVRKYFTKPYIYGDRKTYLSKCTESLCCLSVKRLLFLSTPMINIRNGEDLALLPLLICNAAKISHIDKPCYNYVMRSNSSSLRTPDQEAYKNMLLAFEHIKRNLKSDDGDILCSIEYLGIKTVLYNATLMALKGRNKNALIANIVFDFSMSYPLWSRNINRRNLGRLKNIYLWFLKHKIWCGCRVYAKLHSYILTRHQDD